MSILGSVEAASGLRQLHPVDLVWVAALDLRQQQGGHCAGHAAPEEDWPAAREHNVRERGKIHALQSTAGVPIFFASALKARLEMMAPALPDAADIPCAVERNRVGNTSAG